MSHSDDTTLLYNIKKVKKQAKESMQNGALTKDYPLDVKEACHLLNIALTTEIMCVLRYRHHQITAKGLNCTPIADEFKKYAEEEEKHMLMIAERINQLGGDPDFHPASVSHHTITEYGSADNLMSQITDDLIAERTVITHYRSLINWFGMHDPTTRRMLEKILEDEEHHANELADLLSGISSLK